MTIDLRYGASKTLCLTPTEEQSVQAHSIAIESLDHALNETIHKSLDTSVHFPAFKEIVFPEDTLAISVLRFEEKELLNNISKIIPSDWSAIRKKVWLDAIKRKDFPTIYRISDNTTYKPAKTSSKMIPNEFLNFLST